ncbi:hypothetical protein D9M68_855650 [compost metagenome]
MAFAMRCVWLSCSAIWRSRAPSPFTSRRYMISRLMSGAMIGMSSGVSSSRSRRSTGSSTGMAMRFTYMPREAGALALAGSFSSPMRSPISSSASSSRTPR